MKSFDKAKFLFKAIRPLTNRGESISSGFELNLGPIKCFRSANNEMGLLIPVSDDEIQNFKSDTGTRALHLIIDDGFGAPHVRLVLKDHNQEEIFYLFVDELFKFYQGIDQQELLKETKLFLERWRRFFKAAPLNALSRQQEVGLLCELEVLHKLVRTGHPTPIATWKGPQGFKHDFDLGEFSIECKATKSRDSMEITVHGDDQIEPAKKQLFLVVRRYEDDASGSISIPTLVKEIIEELPAEVDLFVDKLLLLGVDAFSPHAENYFGKYTIVEEFEFEIVEGFPHLEFSDEAKRLRNVSYSIDLSGPESIPGYRTTPEFI